jgi:hypothetical protein
MACAIHGPVAECDPSCAGYLHANPHDELGDAAEGMERAVEDEIQEAQLDAMMADAVTTEHERAEDIAATEHEHE